MPYLQGNLQGLQHLGLPVTDLQRSQAFYAQLGFVTALRTDLAEADGTVFVAMLEKAGLTIELYQLPGARRDEVASRQDGHIDHIALDVLDIDGAFTELKAAGFEILEPDAPVFLPFWSKGVRFFTVRGPDGEKVEFNQRL
ncbi:MAG: VOC family protein [Chloroflexi bacterium]|nr:VOC family protein [Chloroflexota bacterium]